MINQSNRPIEIVLDYDDILWPYVQRVADRLGIDLKIWTTFYVPDNHDWSPELRKRAHEMIMDQSLFRNINFDVGIKDILRPEELGARVLIKSNSISQESIELKKSQLLAAVPKLKPESLRFNLVGVHTVAPKSLGQNTLIFADDCPHNILPSTAPINVMRAWPWNTSPSARALLEHKRRVHVLPDLEAINRFIYYRTKAFINAGA